MRGPDAFGGAFQAMTTERAQAVLVLADPMTFFHRRRLAELAIQHRLPMMGGLADYAEAGSLMSYWADTDRPLPPGRQLRRQDSQGREARRPADRAADQVRVCRQPQDRQKPGYHNSAIRPPARRPSDRMTGPRVAAVGLFRTIDIPGRLTPNPALNRTRRCGARSL